jgi:hypothetical protein
LRVHNADTDDGSLIDEKTMLNRTARSKFGFNVGEVAPSFRER